MCYGVPECEVKYMSSISAARQRVHALLDESSFVEIGANARARATELNPEPVGTLSDGVITGYGVINDKPVCVYSQDSTILGGSIGEVHALKIAAVYDLAVRIGAPVIGLVDSAGLRLQEGVDALNAFAQIYANHAKASGVVPQIMAVFGNCGGGLALAASMSDFTMMEENARMFVNAPNTLAGNHEEENDTANAEHRAKAGVVDFVGSEDEVISKIRELIGLIPSNYEDEAFEENEDEMNRDCSGLTNASTDVDEILKEATDNGKFFELKAEYAPDMAVGFARFGGTTVGVIANRDPLLTTEGCAKAASLTCFCDAFGIPIVTFTNATGYASTIENENRMGKTAARFTLALVSATVPKINVIMKRAYGSAFAIMNPKGAGADFTIAFPNATVGIMDADIAAKLISKDAPPEEYEEVRNFYAEMQNSIDTAAGRNLVDQIVEPKDIRRYLIGALEILYTKREQAPARKHASKL